MRVVAVIVLIAATAACEREARRFPETAGDAQTNRSIVRLTTLAAGGAGEASPERSPYQDNAFGISEGKRLYSAFNCNGCHASGGGAIGPALMDDKWIYGSAPAQIFSTILQGRPDGMPSFRGRVTDDQAWQLVAYVQSLSVQTPRDAAPSRPDDINVMPPENRLDRAAPVQTGHR